MKAAPPPLHAGLGPSSHSDASDATTFANNPKRTMGYTRMHGIHARAHTCSSTRTQHTHTHTLNTPGPRRQTSSPGAPRRPRPSSPRPRTSASPTLCLPDSPHGRTSQRRSCHPCAHARQTPHAGRGSAHARAHLRDRGCGRGCGHARSHAISAASPMAQLLALALMLPLQTHSLSAMILLPCAPLTAAGMAALAPYTPYCMG